MKTILKIILTLFILFVVASVVFSVRPEWREKALFYTVLPFVGIGEWQTTNKESSILEDAISKKDLSICNKLQAERGIMFGIAHPRSDCYRAFLAAVGEKDDCESVGPVESMEGIDLARMDPADRTALTSTNLTGGVYLAKDECFKIVAERKNDPSLCRGEGQLECYTNIAKNSNEPQICRDNIKDEEDKFQCLRQFFANGDYCQEFNNLDLKERCYLEFVNSMYGKLPMIDSYCKEKLTNQLYLDSCYYKGALMNDDLSICQKIVDIQTREECVVSNTPKTN